MTTPAKKTRTPRAPRKTAATAAPAAPASAEPLLRQKESLLKIHRNRPESDTVTYIPPEDRDAPRLILRRSDFDDMGRPDAVTITIRPGDELNQDPGDQG